MNGVVVRFKSVDDLIHQRAAESVQPYRFACVVGDFPTGFAGLDADFRNAESQLECGWGVEPDAEVPGIACIIRRDGYPSRSMMGMFPEGRGSRRGMG